MSRTMADTPKPAFREWVKRARADQTNGRPDDRGARGVGAAPQGLRYCERPSLWSSAPVKGPQEDGEAISEKRVRRLMREEQIQGRVPKRFKHTTDSNHDDPIAANVLARDFTAAAPHVEGPQLAGSHERTPDADPNAAERL
jgi:hypothetical protein